ncbi:hypothetical protein PBAL39_02047 [Pedobacter sp. BAL39]|nr:hypothetical protein PBAL39_02047 [Pedobacter sp. BAL39]
MNIIGFFIFFATLDEKNRKEANSILISYL